MTSLRKILAPAAALLLLGASESAWAQRGGSVRYSGGRSMTTASGTPVRYQKPMNMPSGGYRAAGYSGTNASGTAVRAGYSGTNASGTAVRYQAPVNLPVGSPVRQLPVGYRRMAVAGKNCYYYGGLYYEESSTNQSDGAYTVVSPPLGATVDTLPTGAVQIVPGVYEYNGVKYRPSYEDGKIVYTVSN